MVGICIATIIVWFGETLQKVVTPIHGKIGEMEPTSRNFFLIQFAPWGQAIGITIIMNQCTFLLKWNYVFMQFFMNGIKLLIGLMNWVNVLENSRTRFFIYDLFEHNWIANFIRSSCFIVLSNKSLLCPKSWEMLMFFISKMNFIGNPS